MISSGLRPLFEPRSVALVGASDEPGSMGQIVLANLVAAGFAGEIALVNPKHDRIAGRPAVPAIADLARAPDLAVIVTPAAVVPEVVDQCGAAGVRAAIVISAGFRETGAAGLGLEQQMLQRARQHGLRLLGPNCLGVIRTDIGLNATFSAASARPGPIAVVSQSGALCTALLDWAAGNDVGFSTVVSLGISADVDCGEVLDYLVVDPRTEGIMLYLEGIAAARGFMSALRTAARVKPVVVMKAGRHATGSRAVLSHTGALVGADDVFDAALRRAGVLRVADFADFFAAAATLDSGARTRGNRLAIVTNAGGPGVLAADHCADRGVALASFAAATKSALEQALPKSAACGNPVDVLGDATPERYAAAIRACLLDPDTDGVLAMLTPQAQSRPTDVAARVVELARDQGKPLLTCWMGGGLVADGRALFARHGLPTFDTPEAAVDAFSWLCAYCDNQSQLLQVPEPLGPHEPPDVGSARAIVEAVLADGRRVASLAEAKAVLAAFGIPILRSIPARTAADAVLIAQEIGYPVAVKIDSPDIAHKSDVGGVRLHVAGAQEVRTAFEQVTGAVRAAQPGARIAGVTIEPMARGSKARELMVGVLADEVFGPVLSFGLGGVTVEVLGDRAVALPPLNRFLVRSLIDRTRARALLGAFRGAPPVDRTALEDLLLRVSELVCELPWLQELDLNPVLADEHGAVVVDARLVVRPHSTAARPYDHMAIHPYPSHLAVQEHLPDGTTVAIRPIRPEDAAIERDFVNGLSQQSKYLRFMYQMRELSPAMLSRFTQIDYDREMALIAVIPQAAGERQIGVARYAAQPDGRSCEFAIVVADDWQGRGLASRLLARLIETARQRRFDRMEGTVLRENQRMLAFAQSLGFAIVADPADEDTVRIQLDL